MAQLSKELHQYFFETERSSTVRLSDLFELAKERIFGFLFIILSLPSALPVPAPGYSVPFGILLLLLAIQLIAGAKQPWLPKRLAQHPIALTKVQGFLKAGLPWLRRIESITHPRLTRICTSLLGRTVIGIAISLMAISMCIPIPGTNTLPAIGVFVTGFGFQEDDGAVSLAGLVLCALGATLSISILTALYLGGSSLLDLLKEWMQSGLA